MVIKVTVFANCDVVQMFSSIICAIGFLGGDAEDSSLHLCP